MNDCIKCEGKGIYFAANGPDDGQMEFCDCLMGMKKALVEKMTTF